MKWLCVSCVSLVLSVSSAIHSNAADIVDTAVQAGSFKTLAAALGAADLVSTLKSPGPFTVLAPTDEAFAALPPGTVESLLKPENKAKLASILAYHVIPGRVMAEQVVGLSAAKTVQGQRINIQAKAGTVMVGNASVVQTDIVCDNGVIHVIDAVLLPADQTIPQVAQSAGQFSTLLAAVGAAGLAETLGSAGPFTVFAPTDDAFGALPTGTVASLLQPENKSKLVDVLKYHVVAGRVYSGDALAAKSAATLQGGAVSIKPTEAGGMVNTARLVSTDLDASNGVIHVIDRVLLPPATTTVASSATVHSAAVPVIDARQMLTNAIAQGSHLFNSGHHEACAQLYDRTLQTLVSSPGATMTNHMNAVLSSARSQHSSTDRAWTLRRGIDQMMAQLPISSR